ncbi:MrcB family domain-containing protein [Rhizobium sp. LEGMi12c]
MKLLDEVFQDYRNIASALGSVPGMSAEPALTAIKHDLPLFFNARISPALQSSYRCYGGFGEPNRTFAKVPWVAVCHRSVAKSVKDGYFVVLLFRQDMAGCWLSLNQGFTQYKSAFRRDDLARRQARNGAELLAGMVDVPNGFTLGSIDLGATTDLGKGYESAAVLSRFYSASQPLPDRDFEDDFLQLLEAYDKLVVKVGENPILLLPDAEEPYQAAAAEIARSMTQPEVPSGKLQPRSSQVSKARKLWRRDPFMAAAAIVNAAYQCELDKSHTTFISRATNQNFVEAHHLIPMAHQLNHKYSLDVPENIVALCPTCHRKIHHGFSSERKKMAIALLKRRSKLLYDRGIALSELEIKEIYRHELDED